MEPRPPWSPAAAPEPVAADPVPSEAVPSDPVAPDPAPAASAPASPGPAPEPVGSDPAPATPPAPAPDGATTADGRPAPALDLDAVTADLAAVEAALERLDQGSYGRCGACASAIDDDVLAADPTATTCAAHLPV